ncbi:hypothetical protein A0H81_06672 [Grifola frondosa]|uniref:Uncharacterized protein n=1 Tax=Grifola frondosa TaxID=5627 RepID=A0A1C7M918_GRIFR|nr:hypothetical protein A0H81_06672 [Grifola frondosa]
MSPTIYICIYYSRSSQIPLNAITQILGSDTAFIHSQRTDPNLRHNVKGLGLTEVFRPLSLFGYVRIYVGLDYHSTSSVSRCIAESAYGDISDLGTGLYQFGNLCFRHVLKTALVLDI